jgi:hypothetical protein
VSLLRQFRYGEKVICINHTDRNARQRSKGHCRDGYTERQQASAMKPSATYPGQRANSDRRSMRICNFPSVWSRLGRSMHDGLRATRRRPAGTSCHTKGIRHSRHGQGAEDTIRQEAVCWSGDMQHTFSAMRSRQSSQERRLNYHNLNYGKEMI